MKTRTAHACLQSAMADITTRQLVERLECCVIADRIADTSDATLFPEIAKAQAHLAGMTPERRAELNREWEA